jgi:hypothetical protein
MTAQNNPEFDFSLSCEGACRARPVCDLRGKAKFSFQINAILPVQFSPKNISFFASLAA